MKTRSVTSSMHAVLQSSFSQRTAGLLILILASGCGDDGKKSVATEDTVVPGALECSDLDLPDEPELALRLVAEGFVRPIFAGSTPITTDNRLFVVEQPGRIRIVDRTTFFGTPFLDITDRVGSNGNEQGLLGLAFHPSYEENGRFFVNYTEADGGNTVVSEFQVSSDPNRADASSERKVILVDQPFSNHNGGMIAFNNSDGFLYIGMGDGGSGGDPQDNGENTNTLLGAILRIDVDSETGEEGMSYAIPESNPFSDSANGEEDPRPEIWAYGLRNPFRFSFDRQTDDLYIGDVGQNNYEEIDFQPAASTGGEDYGWDIREGRHCHEPAIDCEEKGIEPVSEYPHDGTGCSVTGGYVYRGSCLPSYVGQYIFGDYCSNRVWAADLAGVNNDSPPEINFETAISGLSSFGENAQGDLFITSLADGKLYQIVSK